MNSFENLVDYLVPRPELHARFLNTMSLLEYIGARKIMKSQLEQNMSSEVLSHIAEEVRHARTFKKLALKIGGNQLDTFSEENLLCASEAKDYFQTLDHACAEVLIEKNPELNYLLTTLLIEERASVLYPYYNERLSECGFEKPLSGIIREEESHLNWVRSELKQRLAEDTLAKLYRLEENAFQKWILSTLKCCNSN